MHERRRFAIIQIIAMVVVAYFLLACLPFAAASHSLGDLQIWSRADPKQNPCLGNPCTGPFSCFSTGDNHAECFDQTTGFSDPCPFDNGGCGVHPQTTCAPLPPGTSLCGCNTNWHRANDHNSCFSISGHVSIGSGYDPIRLFSHSSYAHLWKRNIENGLFQPGDTLVLRQPPPGSCSACGVNPSDRNITLTVGSTVVSGSVYVTVTESAADVVAMLNNVTTQGQCYQGLSPCSADWMGYHTRVIPCPGWQLAGGIPCRDDINECATTNGGCTGPTPVCTNSPGSFTCLA